MKTTLKVSTPVGEFTRTTGTNYTHVVVWNSPRATECFNLPAGTITGGVHGRWIKDRGHGVTWHMSEGAARRAASGKYSWDHAAALVGVFPVTSSES